MDDPVIKTLVEELCDLDSIGQIFCLALGQLLWFVMPLFSCWKMGMAGLICLAEVRGDRWSRVLGYKIEKLQSSQKSTAAASAPESFWESRIQLTQGRSPRAGISAQPFQRAHSLTPCPCAWVTIPRLQCQVCTLATGLAESVGLGQAQCPGVSPWLVPADWLPRPRAGLPSCMCFKMFWFCTQSKM